MQKRWDLRALVCPWIGGGHHPASEGTRMEGSATDLEKVETDT